MPTYIKNTRVRRTWRERLFSLPWRPWQATKIVSQEVNGPYPWARDPIPGDDFINLAQQRTRAFPRPQVIRATTPRAVDDPQQAVRSFYGPDTATTSRWAPNPPYHLEDDRSTFDGNTPVNVPVQQILESDPRFVPGGGSACNTSSTDTSTSCGSD